MSARAYEENLECYYNCAQAAINELFEADIEGRALFGGNVGEI
jgi:hypothetical protein